MAKMNSTNILVGKTVTPISRGNPAFAAGSDDDLINWFHKSLGIKEATIAAVWVEKEQMRCTLVAATGDVLNGYLVHYKVKL